MKRLISKVFYNRIGKYNDLRNQEEEGIYTYNHLKATQIKSSLNIVGILILLMMILSLYILFLSSQNGVSWEQEISRWIQTFIKMRPDNFNPDVGGI